MSRLIVLLVVAGLLTACAPSPSPAPTSAAPAAPAAQPAASPAAAAPAPAAAPAASPVAAPAAAAAAPAASPAAAAASAYKPTPLNPPVKLSVGVLASSSDGGIFIAQERGYFQQEGIEIEYPRFQSLVEMVAPVSAGQIDIAAGGLAAGLFNAIGRDVNLRVVADKGQTSSPEFEFSALMIRKDLIESGKVKDYKDLQGLTLVTSSKGVSPEVALAASLAKGGLTLSDVNYTNMPFPDMVTALANKSIDGGIVIEPFLSRIESEGTAVRWKGNLEILGHPQQIALIVYGPKMFANPDLGRRWMTAYVRGLRDYNDAFGPKKQGYDDAVNALIKFTTVKDPKVYAQMRPAGLDPDGKVNLESIKEDLDYYMKSGQVRTEVDLSKLIDTSFQEYAVKTLVPYQR